MKPAPCKHERRLCSAGLAAFLLWPAVVSAHGEDMGDSLLSGFMHPLTGPDHLLAMLSVGIVSALIGGRAVLWVPAAFVASMVTGGALGAAGAALPQMELGIALSVLLLGAAVALPRRFPVGLAALVVGVFGVWHGNAHGVEMPRAAAPVFYSLGFVFSTALIHLLGVGLGFLPLFRGHGRVPVRVAGLCIAACGCFFLVRAVLP